MKLKEKNTDIKIKETTTLGGGAILLIIIAIVICAAMSGNGQMPVTSSETLNNQAEHVQTINQNR